MSQTGFKHSELCNHMSENSLYELNNFLIRSNDV